MSRAGWGQDVIPITMMMLRTDGPRIAASTIASGRNGITRNHSVIRISTPPILPPKKPAAIPTIEPITTASSVATRPTSRLVRAPQMNCVRTSRPRASVPSGANSAGLANVGLWTVLIALQAGLVGEQRRGQRHRHGQHQDAEADHPGQVVPVLVPRPAERAPPAEPRDPPRGGDLHHGRAGLAHAGLTRGSR